MARPGVTYTEVAEAAAHIIGQGKNPTIEQIRLLLGTGSSTTIANHIKEWKERQQGSSLLAARENIPVELVEMVKGLWERVIGISEEKVSVVEAAFETKNAELQQDVQKYKANNQRWQHLFNQWQQEKEKLVTDKLVLEQVVESLQIDKISLQSKLAAQEQQLQDKQERVNELNRLHLQTQTNLEHYRESSAEQRRMDQEKHAQQLQQVEMALKNAENQLRDMHQEKQNLQQQLSKMTHDNESLQSNNKIIADTLDKLQNDFTHLEKELFESKHQAAHWQKQYAMTQGKYDDQINKSTDYEKQIAILTDHRDRLQNQLSTAEDKIEALREEKLFIAQEKAELQGNLKLLQETV